MNFGFTEEQELLRATARDFLAEHAPMTRVREVMEGSETHASELWSQMAELGWTGLTVPEEQGGAGLSIIELCILLEELGRCLAPVPFLPTAIAATAFLEAGHVAQREAWLPRIASGQTRATLAITEERGSEEPRELALVAKRAGEAWELTGRKLFVPDAEAANLLVVVARTGGEGEDRMGLFLVPRDAAGISVEPMRSMDLLRPLARIDFQNVQVPGDALLGSDGDGWPTIERILDRARVMICAEMVGGADKCLEDSVAYAKERVQFGKPIGVNQAIKHKCADMLFEVESSKSITYYAAWAAREQNDEAPVSAAMAKAYVSDAYRRVSAENIQIHGGVGFTWEYDCHLYFKRAKSDEVWLGNGSYHRERVARMLKV
jgi:alkylation response protein AidB-like acyl-CoA dehydrogenase